MKSNWWVLDRFLLDRVFQTTANVLHEKRGWTPQVLAQTCGYISVAAMLVRYFLNHPLFEVEPDALLSHLALPGIFLMATFIPERLGSNGRNLMRLTLFPARAVMLVIAVYMFGLVSFIPKSIQDMVVRFVYAQFDYILLPTPLLATTAYAFGILFIWALVAFLSVDDPPPRKFAAARNWNMAR